jgi:hydrogenase maturation protease
MSPLVIIGCGNLMRHDDAAGVLVAQRLREWLERDPSTDRVVVYDAGTAGMDVMFQAKGATSLIIVDACRSGSPAGSIFKLGGDELGDRPRPGLSLHDFRWDHAVYAGRTLFREAFPRDVTVYLIEAADTGLGLEVSPEVAGAVEKVVALLKEVVRSSQFEVPPQIRHPRHRWGQISNLSPKDGFPPARE